MHFKYYVVRTDFPNFVLFTLKEPREGLKYTELKSYRLFSIVSQLHFFL